MISNGKAIAEHILQTLEAQSPITGSIAFIQFGNDAASTAFIQKKLAIAKRLNVTAEHIHIPDTCSEEDACAIVTDTAQQGYIGIVVQLPLPAPLTKEQIIACIPPEQDIDALRPDSPYRAPVACAVQETLTYYSIPTDTASIVIMGNGSLVGAPVYTLFKNHANVQQYDHTTPVERVREGLLNADIIITGIGSPHSITPSMIKKGCVLIDAGTSEQHNKIVGDCHPDCIQKTALFSTTPGGIGPITIACLFQNVYKANYSCLCGKK